MIFHMKFAIRTAVLIFLLGTIASANAQQDEHKQEGKPGQQQGKPAQQQRQAQPAARQQSAQPAQHNAATRASRVTTHPAGRPWTAAADARGESPTAR